MKYKSVIYQNKKVADNVYLMEVDNPCDGKPGQFYMLKAWNYDPFLGRPFGICDVVDGRLFFLYEVVGKGTKLLSNLSKGDFVDLTGPLGNSFPLSQEKAALVAGGCGLAPMVYLAKHLPVKPDVYLGFSDEVFGVELFRDYVDQIFIVSENGPTQLKGFVTEFIEPTNYSTVYGCGPRPMMKALKEKSDQTQLYLSMDAHMACGIGACLGCTINTSKGYQRVCVEGPVFDSKEVLLDER